MKRFLAVLLGFVLIASVAFAEVDLSSMTFDELIALKDKINLAIWNSQEWQEVTVPQGVWKIGEDIPEGHWAIKCANSGSSTFVIVGYAISEDGKNVDRSTEEGKDIWYWEEVYGEDGYGDLKEWDYEFKEGMYVQIDHSNSIFTPYAGKPSLDFK